MADQNKEQNNFNRDIKRGTVSLLGFIIRHPIISLTIVGVILLVSLVLFVIFAVSGAPASFSDSVEEGFNGTTTDAGKLFEDLTDEEKAAYYDDAENIYQAIESGKIKLDSNELINLDEKSVKKIFQRIHDYEERRKEEKNVNYTYRVEKNKEPEYEYVVHEEDDGSKWTELVVKEKGYHYQDHEIDPLGTIDTDKIPEKNVTYTENKDITVERKQLETVYEGERDLMKIDWQPVFALLSCVAVDNYENWDEDKMINNKDKNGTYTLDEYFLKDAQIDAVIDIFAYDDKSANAYYYDLIDSGTTKFKFLNMVKTTCAFKLTVDEEWDMRTTERIPCSAPNVIKNKYRKFEYKYEDIKDNSGTGASAEAGAETGEEEGEEDKEKEEEASGGSNVTIIGDSITEYSLSELSAELPNALIDGKAGRTVHLRSPEQQGGLETAEKLKAAGDLRDIVVFAMGSNNAGPEVNNQPYLSEEMLDQLKAICEDRRVFLVTNYDMSDAYEKWWEKNNAVIRSYAAKTPNWSVIDWAGKTGPSYMVDEPDGVHKGVHPNAEGKKLFAKTIKDALEPYLNDKKQQSTPQKGAKICTERVITTSGTDFVNAVKAIDPDFDWEFFFNNLEPLPNSEKYLKDFEELKEMADRNTDKVTSTTDANESSAIGTIVINGKTGAGDSGNGAGGYNGEGAGEFIPGTANFVDANERGRYIYDELIKAGFTPEAAAGILGNLEAEHGGFNTAWSGDSGSVGICQWLGDRKTALMAFCDARGAEYTDLAAQVAYMISEFPGQMAGYKVNGVDALTALKTCTDPEVAAQIFCICFERPDHGSTPESRKRHDIAWSNYVLATVDITVYIKGQLTQVGNGVYWCHLDRRMANANGMYAAYAN